MSSTLKKEWGYALLSIMLASGSAFATPTEDLAREALRKQDYPTAAQYARQSIAEDPSSALNWYRLALASFRLGDKKTASESLQKAKTIDPSLSFASSQDRVLKLEQSISSMEGVIPVSAPIEKPSAGFELAVEDDFLRKEIAVLSQNVIKTNEAVMAMQQEAKKSALQPKTSPIELAAYFAILFVCGGLIGFLWDKVGKWFSSRMRNKRSARPLQDVVHDLRDDTARLLQRLEIHGHTSTELHAVASRLLPALEREAGRTKIDVRVQTTGIALKDIQGKFKEKAELGETSSKAIHQSISQRIVAEKLHSQKAA